MNLPLFADSITLAELTSPVPVSVTNGIELTSEVISVEDQESSSS